MSSTRCVEETGQRDRQRQRRCVALGLDGIDRLPRDTERVTEISPARALVPTGVPGRRFAWCKAYLTRMTLCQVCFTLGPQPRAHPAALPLGSSELRSQRRAAADPRRGPRLRADGDRARVPRTMTRPANSPTTWSRAWPVSGSSRSRSRRRSAAPAAISSRTASPWRRSLAPTRAARSRSRRRCRSGSPRSRNSARRAARALARTAAGRRAALGIRAHRARCRIRRGGDPDPSRARR